jgi:hypothetical protein
VIARILDPSVSFTLTFDPLSGDVINISIPQPPARTRQGLIDYLTRFHDVAQGGQYHEDLGTAVLFGCGR